MSSLFYFFKESLTGFTRNLSTTLGSIITIFLSLLIIGIFLVGGLIVDNTVKSVEDKVSITAYVSDDAEQSDIDTVMKAIEKMDGVQSVDFTTKDEALQNFSNSMSSSEIVDQLDGMNPLPASIDVELADPQMVEGIASQIEGNSTFAKIADEENPADSIKYGQSSVKRLFELTNYIRYIGRRARCPAHLHCAGVHQQHHPLGHFGTPQGNRHHASRGSEQRLHSRAFPYGRRDAMPLSVRPLPF